MTAIPRDSISREDSCNTDHGALFRDGPKAAPIRTRNAGRAPIRLATAADSDGILSVYAPFIETPVTFEEEVPAQESFRARIAGICERFPCLVAEAAGEIVGFAYAHELRERIAFQWNAELSVYLAPHAQARGLGRALYAALIELLRGQGIKAVYGVVTSPNPASERLHEAFGFRLMGTQPHAGFTCGTWHDVNWFVREIAPFEDDPHAPVPFPAFAREDPAFVRNVLERANAKLAK